MRISISANQIASALLFLCIPFSLFFQTCTLREYDLNQKIDRGFIGNDAVFFAFSNQEGVDNVSNANDEQTSIEEVFLSLQTEDFLVAKQSGTQRAVYYQGAAETPPLLEGRFFTSKECLSEEPLAVIGKSYQDMVRTESESGKTLIDLEGKTYEVIGIAGIDKTTTVDDLVYVNFGSLSYAEQLVGRYYIDTINGSAEEVFSEFAGRASEQGLDPVWIDVPVAATDVIAGGVFMAGIIKAAIVLFLFITYTCIMMLFLLTSDQKISVYTLVGMNRGQTMRRIFSPIFLSGIGGILMASCGFYVIFAFHFFPLPNGSILQAAVLSISLTVILLIAWVFPLLAKIRKYNLSESLR